MGHEAASAHSAHEHAIAPDADRRYLRVALVLLCVFLVTEVVVALVSGSLALLSDAGHMLSDIGAVAAALWVMSLAARPARGAWTYGLKRAEILSAAGNGITLLVVSALVTAEAIKRLADPSPVTGVAVVVVAGIGIAINVAATAALARANRTSLNIRGAYQHVLTDLYGFIATGIAGVIILATGWTRADPIASLVVVGLMLRAAWGLLRDSGRVLLEAAPEGVDLDELRGHLLGVTHVLDVHDLHVWTVTSNLSAVSVHVVVEAECFTDGHAPQILDTLQTCLTGHFDVEHSTFQLEPAGHAEHEAEMH